MHLTKRAVENLEVTGKRYEVRDDTQTGFVVRVGVKGDRAFYYVYRAGKGRAAPLKRLHIGSFPNMTVEQARSIVKEKAAQVALGGDPAQETSEAKAALSVTTALNLFLQTHGTKIKSDTLKSYERMANSFVKPALGKYKVGEITHAHIAALHTSMKDTPYQANRCLALVSKFFSWCAKNGHRKDGSNPAEGVERFPEQKRLAFMGPTEMEALGRAFQQMEQDGYIDIATGKKTALDPFIAASLKILMLTGARCGEILTLKWEYIDITRGIANLPDSKTGAKALHLPAPALAILEELPRLNEYCFPGRRGSGHIVNIKDTWKRLLTTAGLSGWRIHDLRHAFASYAACSGKSLPVIGAILGHSQPATTARYAHLANNPVTQAAEETASTIFKDFTAGKK